MKKEEIEKLFFETINQKATYGKALHKKLSGVNDDKIYNWKKGRQIPSIGDMLDVLYQLDLIKVSLLSVSNESPNKVKIEKKLDSEVPEEDVTIWNHNVEYDGMTGEHKETWSESDENK